MRSAHKLQETGSSLGTKGPKLVPSLKKPRGVSSAVVCTVTHQNLLQYVLPQPSCYVGRSKGRRGSGRGGNHRGHVGSGGRGVGKELRGKDPNPGSQDSLVPLSRNNLFLGSAKKLVKGIICTAPSILVLQNLYLLAFQVLLATVEACAGGRFDLRSASWTFILMGEGKDALWHWCRGATNIRLL